MKRAALRKPLDGLCYAVEHLASVTVLHLLAIEHGAKCHVVGVGEDLRGYLMTLRGKLSEGVG